MAKHLADAQLPYLRTVATYGGDFEASVPSVVRQLPAVWLMDRGTTGEPRPLDTGKRKWLVPCAWLLMAGARDLRNQAARRGSAASVGVYQMLADTAALLTGRDFGLEIRELEPGPIRSVYSGKTSGQALAIYSQEWRTAYVLALPQGCTIAELDTPRPGGGTVPGQPDQAALPPLGAIGIRYHLLPDDGLADAEDLLTLQGDNP